MDLIYFNSPVVLSFFFISLFALILKYITKDVSNVLLFSTYRGSLLSPFTYLRFITHIFGHQSWAHFMNNFLIILIVGPLVEEKYGSTNLLYMILITAFVTGVISFIFSRNRLLGASGIAYMLICLSSFANIASGKIPLTLILVFVFYIVNEIFSSIFMKDGVSHFGHLIGAICGIIFGFFPL